MSTIELLTPREAASVLGLSVQTLAIWRCQSRYDLPYVKVGACVRYRRADLERFIEANTLNPVGRPEGDRT